MMSKYSGNSGGKGNFGMFIERDKKICAAGVPTFQRSECVAGCLEHYLIQEEVDALLSDSIIPSTNLQKLPPLRRPPIKDMRNAGPFSEAASLINPPNKTKFQTLVDDFKETCYASYWKKSVGKVSDPVPALPCGFDAMTTLGKKLPPCEQLYDIVIPRLLISDKTPLSKSPGYQMNRKYSSPGYNSNTIFGTKVNVDPMGIFVKSCLNYEDIQQGNFMKKPISTVLSNFQERNRSQLGTVLEPNHNISLVSKGFAFGSPNPPPSNVMECLTTCNLNPDRQFYLKCLNHLNTVRKFLTKRFESAFFKRFYLSLRYCDGSKTGWLPKDIVYNYCKDKFIRINPTLLEPLLSMWNAFDGTNIEYKIFTNIINFTLVTPQLPEVRDVSESCLDFRTTYKEMVNPSQEVNNRQRAGLPSGRYFDKDNPVTPNGCCSSDKIYLPQESDAKICLSPSVMTLLGVSHRDMYAKRDKDTVRKVFETAGEKFDDDQFNLIWDNSKKNHSHGWTSFETFRRSMLELK